MSRTPPTFSALADFGPFFTVETHPVDALVAAPWRRMDELLSGDALHRRIEAVRAGLAAAGGDAVEERVAASVAQLGLCARLIAPVIGAQVCGVSIRPGLDELWWSDDLGGAFPLSVPESATGGASLHEWITRGPIVALVDAVATAVPVSLQVLWGNVASAVNSAAVLIGAARPDLAGDALGEAMQLLAEPVLNPSGAAAGPSFVRASCCLIYRVGGSTTAVCGDCVLHDTVRTVT